jgi:hypothetical protein
MKTSAFHKRDRSKYLGRYMLSALGNTVVVELPTIYFGVDMYLKLVDQLSDRMVLNGLECAIQFNSSARNLPITNDENRVALYPLRQPMFIAIVDNATQNLSV